MLCGKTNLKGGRLAFLKMFPFSSLIPGKGMQFCLIRDYKWAHGKPPIFNFWSLWLPESSLTGWGSMLQGRSHSAMLPEVTKASWFSDCACVCARASMCIYVSVCQVQYSPYAIKTLFSRWHAAGLLKYLKWFRFTNILKICLGQPDMKRWLPNLSSSRKAMRLSARFVIWAIPHEFPNIFKYIFLIWSRLCIFMPPPK